MLTSSRSRSSGDFLPIVVFVAVMLALKWSLVWRYGNATPFWDQWDAEAAFLYLPWINGQMEWADWLRAHNEHRILLPRILLIGLFELNGRDWNPLLQMTVNAILHVLALTLLLLWLGRTLDKRARLVLWGAGLLTLLPPFGHQSVLEGIQSAYYFFFLFSFIHLHSMAVDEVFGWRWLWGLISGILSYLSLASGAVTLLVGALVLAARAWTYWHSGASSRYAVKSAIVASVLLGCLVVASVVMTPTQPAHAGMRSHDFSETLYAAITLLAWPSPVLWLGMITIQLPWVVLMFMMMLRVGYRTPDRFFVMGVGLWVAGHIAAISLVRASEVGATRYLDILVISLPLNIAAWLDIQGDYRSRVRAVWYGLGLLWVGLVFWGGLRQLPDIRDGLGHRRVTALEQEHNLRAFLCTGDMRNLQGKGVLQVPYPHPKRLAHILESPGVREFLPHNIYRNDPLDPRGVPGDPMCQRRVSSP